MDSYKLSQNPGKAKKPINNKKRSASRSSKRRTGRSLDPQLVLGGIVLVMILVLAGLAWAHYFGKTNPSPNSSQTGGNRGTVVVPAKTFSSVTEAIGNNKAADLNHYYASQVHVVMVGSKYDKMLGSADVNGIISNPLNSAQSPWNWHVPPGDLSAWQTGPYGQYFDGNVIVGISSDGTVISVGLDDNGQITTIFEAPVGDLTTPSNGGSSGGDAGGSSTPSGGNNAGGSSPVNTPPSTTTHTSD
jgi:uncharacterized membrane protein YgcG